MATDALNARAKKSRQIRILRRRGENGNVRERDGKKRN